VTAEIDVAAIAGHVQLLHRLAQPLADKGKLVVASFGENPDTGRELPPKIRHFEIGNADGMTAAIVKLSQERHRNVYAAMAVFKKDLMPGRKGEEADVIGALGLVGDFDDADAARWDERLPLSPSYIIESSSGRFQTFHLLAEPAPLDRVKPVAARLKNYAGCDHGTADLSHVWRIPGTLNWPNAKKVAEGRPRDPQLARIARECNGARERLEDIAAALPEIEPAAKSNGADPNSGHDFDDGEAQPIDLQSLPLTIVELIVHGTLDGRKVQKRGPRFMQIARRLHRFGFASVLALLATHPDGVQSKYIEGGRLDVELRRVWGKIESDNRIETDLIDRFNNQYAVVNENGRIWVYEQVHDTQLQRDVLVRFNFSDFKKMYMNELIGEDSVGNVWLAHARRRQYLGGVVFDPTGKAPDTQWNLWKGFAVEPKEGNWCLMHDHIDDVLCGGIVEHRDYLLNTIAYMIQHPERQAEVAVVLRGEKGCGKGVLCVSLRRLLGQHGIHISNAKHLVGNFNQHLRDCIYIFADEAFFAGDKQHEGVLKALITEPTIAVEGKFRDVVLARNLLHVWLATNADWVVPASHDERRYFLPEVSNARVGDKEYFTKLWEEIETGGLAAMLHDMLRRDISKFDHRDIPQTKALAEQKELSLDSLDAWWLTVLDRGFVWVSQHGLPEFNEWGAFVTTELLMASYLRWCQENRVFYPASRELLGKRMKEVYVPTHPRGEHIIGEAQHPLDEFSAIIAKSHQRGYGVGTLDLARDAFAKRHRIDAVERWKEDMTKEEAAAQSNPHRDGAHPCPDGAHPCPDGAHPCRDDPVPY
jgi:hypothetical protein